MLKCPNCSAELTQEYCSNRGQRRIRPDDLPARGVVRELFDQVANLEMKFKTVRTLRGLAIPGLLTAEYLEGRRQRYLTVQDVSRVRSHPLKRVYQEPMGLILLKAGALMLLVVSLNGLANVVAIRLTLALA